MCKESHSHIFLLFEMMYIDVHMTSQPVLPSGNTGTINGILETRSFKFFIHFQSTIAMNEAVSGLKNSANLPSTVSA